MLPGKDVFQSRKKSAIIWTVVVHGPNAVGITMYEGKTFSWNNMYVYVQFSFKKVCSSRIQDVLKATCGHCIKLPIFMFGL